MCPNPRSRSHRRCSNWLLAAPLSLFGYTCDDVPLCILTNYRCRSHTLARLLARTPGGRRLLQVQAKEKFEEAKEFAKKIPGYVKQIPGLIKALPGQIKNGLATAKGKIEALKVMIANARNPPQGAEGEEGGVEMSVGGGGSIPSVPEGLSGASLKKAQDAARKAQEAKEKAEAVKKQVEDKKRQAEEMKAKVEAAKAKAEAAKKAANDAGISDEQMVSAAKSAKSAANAAGISDEQMLEAGSKKAGV